MVGGDAVTMVASRCGGGSSCASSGGGSPRLSRLVTIPAVVTVWCDTCVVGTIGDHDQRGDGPPSLVIWIEGMIQPNSM